MIKIKIPANNIQERKYIIEVVFSEFLGLDHQVETGSDEYEILLPNQRTLLIKDTFFNKYPDDLTYLKLENIPKGIKELDVFATCFFMLTRWEEYVNKKRDRHNRFPATESLAYKEGFLNRPIVNEKIEALKKRLLEKDNTLLFKKREFTLVLTHDVDSLYRWKNLSQLFRTVAGDILKRKNPGLAMERVKEYSLVKTKKRKDPFDTFDWLMDKSEKAGIKSRFYFMSGGVTVYDNHYRIDEQKTLELIEKIRERGHLIGIHPSYNAYNDGEQLKKEKIILENIVKQKITEGREHYLRFEVPTTWQIWEDNGMEIDSTCGYADREGFRCGTGDPFSVFNILTRQKLKLKERPLIVMDGSFTTYQENMTDREMEKKVTSLVKKAREYNTTCTILWHNSSFYGALKKNHTALYDRVLKV